MTDTDKMPFGKYTGTPMQDVPVSYLHWLWFNGLKNQIKTNQVAQYISENMTVLEAEDKDLIWH